MAACRIAGLNTIIMVWVYCFEMKNRFGFQLCHSTQQQQTNKTKQNKTKNNNNNKNTLISSINTFICAAKINEISLA